MLLFTERSLLTMLHGLVFGGAALLMLSAALFYLVAVRERETRAFAWLSVATAVVLWLAVIGGTYVVFPPYRATPPPGLTDLSQYPRSLVQASPDTRWLHAFGMELKEHAPWIAAMLATAVAFISVRYRGALMINRSLRGMATALVAIAFALVSFVSVMGVFVNKVAPLE